MTAVVTATRYGPMLVPPNDTYVAQALIRLGEYSPREFDTWRPYLTPDAVVIDGGANLGAHSMAFARACPAGRVIAVEPQRMLAYMLAGSAALNGLGHIDVRNLGLGDTPVTHWMPNLDYGAPNNFGSLRLEHQIPPRPDDVLIQVETIDSWCMHRLDFLKLDVEGCELAALRGAQATIERCRPVIAVEANLDLPGLFAWMRAHQYDVWFHHPPYGSLWPGEESANLLALPVECRLPAPEGDVEQSQAQ